MNFELMIVLIIIIFLAAVIYDSSWGYAPLGVMVALLIGLFLWILLTGKSPRTTGQEIKNGLQTAGGQLKEITREGVDAVRDTVNDIKK